MLIKCKACGKEVSENAHTCPNCGEPIKLKGEGRSRCKPLGFAGIAVIAIGVIGGYVAGRLFDDSAIPAGIIFAVGVIGGGLMAALGFSAASATND